MFFLTLGLACATAIGLWVLTSRTKSKLPYPPGPKPGLPFIGNAFDIDPQRPHLTYAQWGKIYGEIVYTRTLGQDIIIVNSEKTSRIMADGRSAIYSGPYRSPVLKDYGSDRMTPALECGNEWKTHRRLFHLSIRSDVVDKYNDLYLDHARRLSQNILDDSTKLFEHVDLYTGAILVQLIYGQRVEGKDDLIFAMTNGLAELMTKELTAHKLGLLTVMPFLRYLPSWFPGAGFKRKAAQCKEVITKVAELPFAMAKDEMASHWSLCEALTDFAQQRGILSHCMISDMLRDGGVEESAAVLKTVVLVMILYPDVQDKVHAELDAVIGRETRPTFADRPQLPYLQAVLYEVLRWNPPAPLGLPHVTTASDIYEGYYIPKGAPLFCNRAMKDHGYDDPDRFDPTRHLTPDGQLSPEARQNNSIFYGFGKRVCPGHFFADHSIWAATAVLLSTLKFGKANDSSGKYIEVEPLFANGLVR
ncbi:cytochrome P450 [Pisolithus thermaeus]|nr:cytochrome P450 [Pisolithus thermaeus]